MKLLARPRTKPRPAATDPGRLLDDILAGAVVASKDPATRQWFKDLLERGERSGDLLAEGRARA